jgi:hypothetical protein
MSRPSHAHSSLPSSASAALLQLGQQLGLARKRRKESLRAWALRLDVSVPTLCRMEEGDPKVAIGVYATALWLIGLEDGLKDLAAPHQDLRALDQEMVKLSRKRKEPHV